MKYIQSIKKLFCLQELKSQRSYCTAKIEGEKTVAIIFVLVSMCFSAYLTSPLLTSGFNNAGDDSVHVAYCHDLARSIADGEGIFSWSDMYGLGAPRFIFRPPGFYICAVALHKASFGLINIGLAEKLVYMLSFCLFPLSVAFMMSAFGFRPLVVGFASIFSITPISTWGHTIDAYFYLGLAKQCVAILLFPLTLGTLHLYLTKSLRYGVLSVLLCSFMFLNHPYMAYLLFLVMGIYVVSSLLVNGIRGTARTLGLLICYATVFVLLLGIYLVPFYSSEEIHKTVPFSSTWRYEFEIIGDTIYGTTKALFSGGIFDTTAYYKYGTKDWGWRDNSAYGRWPILTVLCLLGMIAAVVRPKKFNHVFLGLTFLFSLTLFTGPDDFPILLRIPFQSQFQYVHSVYLLELAAVALAGMGAVSIVCIGKKLVNRFIGNDSQSEKVYSVSLMLLVAVVLAYSPYKERYYSGTKQIRTRNIGTVYGSVNDPQKIIRIDTDYDKLLPILQNIPSHERLYFAPTGKADPIEVAYSTILPAVINRPNVIDGFFSVEVGGVNYLAVDHFRSDMRRHYNLLDLFNVHYIVSHRTNIREFDRIEEHLRQISCDNWLLYEVLGDHDLLYASDALPIAVCANWQEWELINKIWLRILRDSGKKPENMRPLLKYEADIRYPESFPDTIVMRSQIDNHEIPIEHVAMGNVIEIETLNEDELRKKVEEVLARHKALVPASVHREVDKYSPNQINLRIESSSGRYMSLKNAFYNSWRITIDGIDSSLYDYSPGFCGFYLPPGKHMVQFRYEGPNKIKYGTLISFVGIALCTIVTYLLWRRKHYASRTKIV